MFYSNDSNLVLHHFSHLVVNPAWVLSTFPCERCNHIIDGLHDLFVIDARLGETVRFSLHIPLLAYRM